MNPLIHELFQRVRWLQKELNYVLNQHGLFAAQWTVLYTVYQHEEMTLTEITNYLNVEAPTITRTVRRLVEMGWLQTKSGKDRREKIVALTANARQQFTVVQKTVLQFEEMCLADLTDEETYKMIDLLRKLQGVT